MLNTSEFLTALTRLFAGVPNLNHYAEAAALLSDETKAKAAFQLVDERLLSIATAKNYFIRSGGAVEARIGSSATAERPKTAAGQFFSFIKPLREMEAHYGLTDKQRTFIGFVPEATFTTMVQAGEVWKDSISPNHGEYTHRLQWLAIAEGAYIGRKTLQAMYKDSLRVSAVSMRDRNPRTVTTLWDFLVDCFPSDAGTSFTQNAGTGDEGGDNNVGRYITTTTFRSPGNTTEWLRTNAAGTTPFITKYLASSKAKTDLARKGIQQYRVDRIQAKHNVALRGPGYGGEKDVVFTPPDAENWADAWGDRGRYFYFDGLNQRVRYTP